MKCPECSFVSSNKNDICPKCFSDFRPQKRILNLPISNPKTSVEDLKKQLFNQAQKQSIKSSVTKQPEENISPSQTPQIKHVVKPAVEISSSQARAPKPRQPFSGNKSNDHAKSLSLVSDDNSPPLPSALLKNLSPPKPSILPDIPMSTEEKTGEIVTNLLSNSDVDLNFGMEDPLHSLDAVEPELEPLDLFNDNAFLDVDDSQLPEPNVKDTGNFPKRLAQDVPTFTDNTSGPKVVEFKDEDDAELEKQIAELLGDSSIQIEHVSTTNTKKSTSQKIGNQFDSKDDLEVLVEFDTGSTGSEQVLNVADRTNKQVSESHTRELLLQMCDFLALSYGADVTALRALCSKDTLPSAENFKEQVEDILAEASMQKLDEHISQPNDKSPNVDSHNIDPRYKPSSKLPNLPNEIWEHVLKELTQANETTKNELEISMAQIAPFPRNDTITLLFDVAKEELSNPSINIKRGDKETKRNASTIHNRELQKAFEKFGAEIDMSESNRDEFYTLTPKYDKRQVIPDTSKLSPASAALRLKSGAFDFVFYLIISILISCVGFLPMEILFDFQLFDALPYVFDYFTLAAFLFLTITTLCTYGRGQTVGQKFFRIGVLSESGYDPTFVQSLLWSGAQILNLFSCGFYFFKKGKKPLQDSLAEVIVVSDENLHLHSSLINT